MMEFGVCDKNWWVERGAVLMIDFDFVLDLDFDLDVDFVFVLF